MSFELKDKDISSNTPDRPTTFDPDRRVDVMPDREPSSAERFDPDKRVEINEKAEVTGGSYRDVKKNSDSDKYEVHHTPADSVSHLEGLDSPAIRMEKADHKQTASWGSSKEAKEYRSKQKELIEAGKFKEAVQMDIDDIKSKFGDKYDNEIKHMKEYVNKLESEHRI